MAKAMVKCKFCGKTFDRNDPTIKFIKIKNRYAHQECYDKQNKEDLEEDEAFGNIIEYLTILLGDDFEFVKTKRMLEGYKEKYNFTYTGIYKALKWYYEIDNGDKSKAGGAIGIIPYIYEKAYKYYFDLYQKQQLNRAAAPYHLEVQTVTIQSPRAYVQPPRLFDLGED